MKIAYITNTRFPSNRAHCSQIAHMCQSFADCGNEITLFVNDRKQDIQKSLIDFFGFNPNFSIVRVHFGFIFIPYSRIFFILNNFLFFLFTLIKLNGKKFELLYIRDEWLCFFFSFLFVSEKIVYESHEAKYNFAVRRLFKKNIRVVCISEGIYNEYIDRGYSKDKMMVAHDGIDQSFFNVQITKKEARDKLELPQDKKIVMYIGGFDKWKGVETFFEASKQITDIYFVAIGGREEQVDFYKKKYPTVHFVGSRPYSELKENQQAADVLVIPNTATCKLSSLYTSPLKLFAHMSSGVPIVASDIPSISLVTGSELVTLVEADNVHALAGGIIDVIKKYRKKLRNAQRLIDKSKKYTWKNRAESIVSFINN